MADIGQIGSGFIEIVAKSNVKPGVAQAKREAEQAANSGPQVSVTPEEYDASIAALRAKLAAQKADRLMDTYGTTDLSKVRGAAETLPDRVAMDQWQNRIRPTFGHGDVMQRMAGLAETERGREWIRNKIAQEELARDAKARMSFARTEQESGKLAAGFLRLRHGLETGPFPGLARLMPTTLGGAAGASGAAGIAAVMAGIWKADRDWKGYRSDAFTASPIAGFWAQQGERDASAIRGRTVLSQVNEQTRIERENTNAREFWRLQTKMGNRPGIFNQARWEQDWAQLSGWIGSFRSKLSNWGLDAEKAKAAGVNTLGAGGYERLGQWFNGADQLAMAFQSAASQSPIGTNEKDNIEAIRKNTEALDKLRQQQEQAKQEAWDKIRAAPMEAAFNLFGPK